jgi:hypothetical protein
LSLALRYRILLRALTCRHPSQPSAIASAMGPLVQVVSKVATFIQTCCGFFTVANLGVASGVTAAIVSGQQTSRPGHAARAWTGG